MDFTEIGKLIEGLGKERGIKKDIVVQALEQAFLVTARRKYGVQGEFEARYNNDEGEIEIFQYKTVVESVKDSILELSLTEARELDEDADLGDQLGLKIENPTFSRVDIQTVKQIVFQKVRDAEREILFSEFKHREGDLVSGIVRRVDRGNVAVDLGKSDAIMYRRETIYGETFNVGDRVQSYLTEVVMTSRGPEIRLSRTSPLFLIKLFEAEVPEIADGTIQIKAAAREPGQRAKIAVYTSEREIDPVGACVGLKGQRVQNIVNELQGEKIDIVRWNEDVSTFVKNALAPAEVTSINLNLDDHILDVIVEDDQLSLAIGRRGQNVRLAAMLTGWKVNIISKDKLQDQIKASVINLLQLDGLNEASAQMLVQNGVMSLIDLSASQALDVSKMTGLDIDQAQELIQKAGEALDKEEIENEPSEGEEIISASAVPSSKHGVIRAGREHSEKTSAQIQGSSGSKFSDAERRLREELAAFKLK